MRFDAAGITTGPMHRRLAAAAAFVTAGLLAATLATTAARPLYHADLWAHLAYGREVRLTGAVAATEPLMPLSAGERFVNFSWLSGVAGSVVWDHAGADGLRLAGGLLITAAVGFVGVAARRRGRSFVAAWIAGTAFLAIAWFQLFAFAPWEEPLGPQMLRPQSLGLALFAGLLAATPVPRRPGWRWVGLPVGFLLWANLHGSWPIGLAWLAAGVLDRVGRLRFAVWRSGRVRREAALIAICAVVCCVNPLGPGAYLETLTFGRHPNLADVIEWAPLDWTMRQGRTFFCAAALLAVVARLSPKRVGPGEAVVLIGFGLLTCQTSRWLLWWAGPAAVFLGSHAAALLRRGKAAGGSDPTPRRLALIWIGGLAAGLILSGSTWRLATGRPAPRSSYAEGTPVAAAAYLRLHPPAGQMFHAHAFGDYLLFAGPPETQIFVGSHAHLIPPSVWRASQGLSLAAPGWETALDLYRVTTLVVSPADQPRLLSSADASSRWQRAYEDETAVIFDRVIPQSNLPKRTDGAK